MHLSVVNCIHVLYTALTGGAEESHACLPAVLQAFHKERLLTTLRCVTAELLPVQ